MMIMSQLCFLHIISGLHWNGRRNHVQSLQIQTVNVLIHIHYGLVDHMQLRIVQSVYLHG
jgi:hypothetical protein